jgi:hypothetical protein
LVCTEVIHPAPPRNWKHSSRLPATRAFNWYEHVNFGSKRGDIVRG